MSIFGYTARSCEISLVYQLQIQSRRSILLILCYFYQTTIPKQHNRLPCMSKTQYCWSTLANPSNRCYNIHQNVYIPIGTYDLFPPWWCVCLI